MSRRNRTLQSLADYHATRVGRYTRFAHEADTDTWRDFWQKSAKTELALAKFYTEAADKTTQPQENQP